MSRLSGVTKVKISALWHAAPSAPSFFCSSFSSFFLLLLSENTAGGELREGSDAALVGAQGAVRPCLGPRWGGPEAEAALGAGLGSPVPRPARAYLRRASGGCGREERESEGRCSTVSDWCWAGGEGRRPSFYARLAAALPYFGAQAPAASS